MSSRVDHILGKQPYRSKFFYVQRHVLCGDAGLTFLLVFHSLIPTSAKLGTYLYF